jgi:hypothetical protein
VNGLKHQKEKRCMDHFAGLDVSVKETSVCIVDDTGRIVREVRVASEPGALLSVLRNLAYHFKRIGLEAGPLSQWLRDIVAQDGLMSYGTDLADAFRQVGVYTGKILKGAKPADLPVQQLTKFQFAINLQTARALGIEVRPDVLSIADEVIE